MGWPSPRPLPGIRDDAPRWTASVRVGYRGVYSEVTRAARGFHIPSDSMMNTRIFLASIPGTTLMLMSATLPSMPTTEERPTGHRPGPLEFDRLPVDINRLRLRALAERNPAPLGDGPIFVGQRREVHFLGLLEPDHSQIFLGSSCHISPGFQGVYHFHQVRAIGGVGVKCGVEDHTSHHFHPMT